MRWSNGMKPKLSRDLFPAVVSMVVIGTGTNLDGFFIGGALGDNGLAAINLVWPIVAFLTSVGTGLGMGGAIRVSRLRGQGAVQQAETAKNTALALLLLAGVAVGLLLSLICRPLLRLLGAAGEVHTLSVAYARVLCIGAVFQVAGSGLPALLRNDGKAGCSMVYSLIGLGVHLLLDALLIRRWSMAGIAAASCLSQLVIALLNLCSLRPRKSGGLCPAAALPLLRDAAAPFGLNFVPSLVLLVTNAAALREGGVAAVSAYAVMSYAVYTFDYMVQGVCDGIQPTVSYCVGAGDGPGIRRACRCAALLLGGLSVGFAVLTPVLIRVMPGLFSVSSAALAMMRIGFWIYAAAYLPKAAAKLVCACFYAAGAVRPANLLVYLDPLCLTPLALAVCCPLLDVNGVWAAMTAAQFLLAAVSLLLFRRRGTAILTP